MAGWPKGAIRQSSDENGAGADLAGDVEAGGCVVEHEGVGGVDTGVGEDALVVGAGGLHCVDEVGAEEVAEAIGDAHRGQVGLQLPGGLVRRCVEGVAGVGESHDRLRGVREGGSHTAHDVEVGLAGEGPAGVALGRRNTDVFAHGHEPGLLVGEKALHVAVLDGHGRLVRLEYLSPGRPVGGGPGCRLAAETGREELGDEAQPLRRSPGVVAKDATVVEKEGEVGHPFDGGKGDANGQAWLCCAAHRRRAMALHILKSDDGDTTERSELSIFEGGQVWGRGLTGSASKEVTMSVVHFGPGARAGWHRHTTDQILYVVSRASGRLGTAKASMSSALATAPWYPRARTTGTAPTTPARRWRT